MKRSSFREVINSIPRQSTEAILSSLYILPTELRAHLNERLSTDEQFITDPIFEPMFGYKTSSQTMRDLSGNLLTKSFVDALDQASNDYRFPKERKPYVHQIQSWKALLESKNSLVVSSGTGSGKTECFMIPIISDLAKQLEENDCILEGVQALFIYPLNALIQSQKERFSEWTKPYKGKIRYCLYNGLLPLQLKEYDSKKTPEEIIDRKHLWQSPSPLLITNTTMLEYMLIRAQDKNILNKSKGKLKYIVLDEAHTYIGSQAAELSLLLKRVMNAFEVTSENIQFIATSATIGSDQATMQLKKFLSSISGVSESQVSVVFGEHQISPIYERSDNHKTLEELEQISEDHNDDLIKKLKYNKTARDLRDYFISNNNKSSCARSLNEIQQKFNFTKDEAVRWLDLLSATPDKEEAFLPLRLHLLHKTFPGIWTCCDQECSHKDDNGHIENWKYGKVYLKERYTCDCGAPVFRMVTCANCGYPLLEAQLIETIEDEEIIKKIQPTILGDVDEFSLEDDDSKISTHSYHKVFIDNTERQNFLDKRTGIIVDTKDKNSVQIGVYEDIENIENRKCCDDPEIKNNYKPIQGSPFFLSVTLPSLLDYADKGKNTEKGPHNSQKMICFTDSRQGTARMAVKLQQNSERNTFRSILLRTVSLLTEQANQGALEEIKQFEEIYNTTPNPTLLTIIRSKKNAIKFHTTYDEIISELFRKFDGSDLHWINQYYASKDSHFEDDRGKRNLMEILFAREFARRPKKSVNMETLGLLKTVYDFSQIRGVPDAIDQYIQSEEEWKDLLKIIIDFYIRAEGYLIYPENWFKWGAVIKVSKAVLPPQTEGDDKYKWPLAKIKRNKKIINLLSYALNLDLKKETDRDLINLIMRCAWTALTQETHILESSNGNEYKMNLNKIGLARPTEIFVCPVTNRALDVTLRGFSPYSTTQSTPKCQKYSVPLYNYNEDEGQSIEECLKQHRKWLKNNPEIEPLKKLGVWNSISNSIIIGNRYFRTAEHSAQQENRVLKKYEDEFKNGLINVLNCSTTMEMGVDIGGITISSMNNVPPHPANYLQRAGRAGRRKETKAICFTMCKNNAHDDYVFEHPKWAFETKINAPYVDQYSFVVLQRHINALLLSYFFDNCPDNALNLDMKWFMLPKEKNNLKEFQAFCKEAIRTNEKVQNAIRRIIKNTEFQDRNLDLFIPPLDESLTSFAQSWFLEYEALKEQKETENDKYGKQALELKEKRLTEEYLLKELVEYGILPRYGFPVNIVTFDNNNKNNIKQHQREDNMFQRRDLPSRDISTALKEYAPGSEVVIDGLVYKSAGITLNWHIPASNQQVKEIQSIKYIWRCRKCGASGTVQNLNNIHCKVCASQISEKDTQKYIQPAGFTVDFNASVSNDVSTQTFIQPSAPLISAYSEVNNYMGLPYIKYKQDPQGSVIYYTKGEGNGYLLCLECGRMEAYNDKNREKFKKHYRLRSYQNGTAKEECHHSEFSIVDGGNKGIAIGAEIKTDVLELMLYDLNKKIISDQTLAYTLAVAIRNAVARFLNIESAEIGCDVKKLHHGGYVLQLYDVNASGYCSSSNIIKNMYQILQLAKKNLECDCKLCCNKCLLQNDTKYKYEYLDRQLALKFLSDKWINKNTLTPEMSIFGSSTTIATHSVETEIEGFAHAKYLYLFVPDSAEDDDFINSPIYRLINKCSLGGVMVYVCIHKDKMSEENIEILKHLSHFKNVFLKSIPDTMNQNVLAVIGDDTQSYGYATFDTQINHTNAQWGNYINTSILSGNIDITSYLFEDVNLPEVKDIHYDKMYEVSNEIDGKGQDFGRKLLDILAKSLDFQLKTEKIVHITYKDRYLKSPLTFGLFLNFVGAIKDCYSQKWACPCINVETAPIEETYNQTMFFNDWQSSEIRKNVIQIASQNLGVKINIYEKDKKYLEHNRCMSIELSNGDMIKIILDQGFSYWRCVSYRNDENAYPFDAHQEVQATKMIKSLPYICGNMFPTRIFLTYQANKATG